MQVAMLGMRKRMHEYIVEGKTFFFHFEMFHGSLYFPKCTFPVTQAGSYYTSIHMYAEMCAIV